ncbi:MAG: homoserine dehydrogenase, partial [Sphingomonadales bacterium]|nr:homoserine dehydrogenase [Sphingomonadales bacterium]
KTFTEGISRITPEDLAYASELGYRIKHLGIAQQTDKGIEVRVHPTLVHKRQLLANVRGVGNAVQVHGDFVGSTLYYGPGAGADATASAVVADIVDIMRLDIAGARQPAVPLLGYLQEDADKPIVSIEEIESEYYLRIPVQDRVGVMAHVSGVLEEYDISIEAIIQKEPVSDSVPIIILTHDTSEARINQAISTIENLDDVIGEVVRIRVESFADRKA